LAGLREAAQRPFTAARSCGTGSSCPEEQTSGVASVGFERSTAFSVSNYTYVLVRIDLSQNYFYSGIHTMRNMRSGFWTSGLFRRWRKTKPEPGGFQIDFSAQVRLFRQDDWAYLDLFLVNRSHVTVSVEEAVVVLSNLEANCQTSISTGQARLKILQNIRPNETLGVSLVGSIYEAAGRPQGRYSCMAFTDVHFRVGDEWFKKTLDACRLEMAALTVFRLRRPRLSLPKIPSVP